MNEGKSSENQIIRKGPFNSEKQNVCSKLGIDEEKEGESACCRWKKQRK